ncbi:GYD domain-containing protein [Chloroflexota bacterium]
MLFISLLSPEGKGREAIAYLRKLKAPRGITIHGVYMTFGRYDGVVAFEAPDLKKAMDFVIDIGIETGYLVETLSAVPVKEL